jgi:acetyltransferase-like isoleucine patch superfamily enzyme
MGFYQTCQQYSVPVLRTLFDFYRRRLYGVSILAPAQVRISGLSNIATPRGILNLLLSCGPVDGSEPTRISVRGKLRLLGNFALGRGCRLDIGPNATMEVGDQTYINPRTQVIIHHGLRIGRDCAISWECQFLDEDFHEIQYEGKRVCPSNDIVIGDHVWIGSRANIYKGTVIPNGCVVAANSVVKGIFTEENALLAGNPARVVRRNVQW